MNRSRLIAVGATALLCAGVAGPAAATGMPSPAPSGSPSAHPSPSGSPSAHPSAPPSAHPSAPPSAHPSPSGHPSAPPVKSTTLASGLVTPLKVAAGPLGATYVTENFAGQLTKIAANGKRSTLYSAPGADVGGVSYDGHATITFTETGATTTVKQLRLTKNGVGAPTTLADIGAFEAAKNPDSKITYGFRNLPQSCLAQIPADFPAPGKYTGQVDSHPYATTNLLGNTFVADAGANAVFSIDRKGTVHTLAVLPPQPSTITPEAAAGLGLPKCTYGATYWFEAVPTDVEVGPWGQLYVTTLPGGPEDASLGARGALYTVNPLTGVSKQIASGLVGATDVAVSPNGKAYVTQLFGGEISLIKNGKPTTFFSAPLPAAVEWTPKGLLATVNALPADETSPPAGELIRIPLRK